MQPLSLGRVLLILLPGLPEHVVSLPLQDEHGKPLPLGSRRRSSERLELGEPRVRPCRVVCVWSDTVANVVVDLDASDAECSVDVVVLHEHGFKVRGFQAFKTSAQLVQGEQLTSVGTMIYPPRVSPLASSSPFDRQLEQDMRAEINPKARQLGVRLPRPEDMLGAPDQDYSGKSPEQRDAEAGIPG